MIRIFVSHPMKGKEKEQIEQERKEIYNTLVKKFGEGRFEIIDSHFKDFKPNTPPLVYIAKSIELLATADIAYFAKGWYEARGCRIEYQCADVYGIAILRGDDY